MRDRLPKCLFLLSLIVWMQGCGSNDTAGEASSAPISTSPNAATNNSAVIESPTTSKSASQMSGQAAKAAPVTGLSGAYQVILPADWVPGDQSQMPKDADLAYTQSTHNSKDTIFFLVMQLDTNGTAEEISTNEEAHYRTKYDNYKLLDRHSTTVDGQPGWFLAMTFGNETVPLEWECLTVIVRNGKTYGVIFAAPLEKKDVVAPMYHSIMNSFKWK